MPVTPTTPGELYDFLAQRFGIGSWDEGDPEALPYWKYRAFEVKKLKGILTKRRTSVEELFMAAEYAAEQRMVVRQPFDLLKLVAVAKKARAPSRGEAASRALMEATKEAIALGMTDWASRLYTTVPSAADDVLADYEQAKAAARG